MKRIPTGSLFHWPYYSVFSHEGQEAHGNNFFQNSFPCRGGAFLRKKNFTLPTCIRCRQSCCHLPAYLAAYRAIPSIFRPHGQCGTANDDSTLLIDDISYKPPDVKSCPPPFSSQPPHIPRGRTEYGKSTASPTCIWHRQPRSPSSRASHKTPAYLAAYRAIPSIVRPHGQGYPANDDSTLLIDDISYRPPA